MFKDKIDGVLDLLHRVPKDKLLHFFYGDLIACFVSLVLSPWWGVLVATIAATIKESWDYFSQREVESSDFLFTVFGGIVVVLPAMVGRKWLTLKITLVILSGTP